MSSPSPTAGKACAECGMPEPCLHKITATFPKEEENHIWPEEKPVRFTLLDEGEGCEGSITIVSKCSKNGCPKAELKEIENNTSDPLNSDGQPNQVVLNYKGQKDEIELVEALHSPWEYLSSITTPADIFDEPAHYVIATEGCYEKGTQVFIDVYPSFEIRFTAGLSYEIVSNVRERTIKERRDEHIKSRQAMEGAKPKNRNKLRSGWEYHTDKFELTRKTELSVEFGVKICDVDYSKEYTREIQSSKKIRSLEQLNRIDSLVNNINEYFAPDPENSGSTREYTIFSMEIAPVNLEVSYAYQHIDVKDGPCHFLGLSGEPFLSGTFKFDIIQFICAYCKIDSLVGKCRDYLKKHGTSVECYLEFTPEVNINIGAAYSLNDDKWDFNIPEGNLLKLGIEGVVSAAFEAEVFFAEINIGAKGSITTAAGFALDQHDKGLDLAGFHEGINGCFEFVADVRYKNGNNKKTPKKIEKKQLKEWQLADPLRVKDSPLRINLYGIKRNDDIPMITPPRKLGPWEQMLTDGVLNTTNTNIIY